MTPKNRPATPIIAQITAETGLPERSVQATLTLLDEGNTLPFIARYRKERTGQLDEVQIRAIEEGAHYYRELAQRRETILTTIADQGRLTPELQQRIEACSQKAELEDLYLPFKPRRRTKAAIAHERGLTPLADWLFAPSCGTDPLHYANRFIAADVADTAAALAGAGHILAERFSEDAEARAFVRDQTWQQGVLRAKVCTEYASKVSKYEQYYDYREPLKSVPSHRLLAMRRGETEGVLRLSLEAPVEPILQTLHHKWLQPSTRQCSVFVAQAIDDAYKRLIAPSIEVELRLKAKKNADQAAIAVFADNLRHLLLASPAGAQRVLGIDPGQRTGCKCALVDETGCFLTQGTIFPHAGSAQQQTAKSLLVTWVKEQRLTMIAVGNGTAGRETEVFVRQALSGADLAIPVVSVNEAGASVYSASEIARDEFPDLDLTVRGAISIARRLQDPLAELVKIDPKAIGVGQYQHDVSQSALKASLDAVVESCVNFVGVDLNRASVPLLAAVAGIGDSLARAIVAHRERQGPFQQRQQLLEVGRFGAKAFEQAAGFLRIRDGHHPLDNTAVHPERYPVVERMARDLGVSLTELAGNPQQVRRIDLPRYVDDTLGMATLEDIVQELSKPGRDPRETFQTAVFRDDVTCLSDLSTGMQLQGTVTNVTAFGAFVDIGVHQDGLVHISQLADRYVRDPKDVVHVGQIVSVRVVDVDPVRKRVGLSMKSDPSDNRARPTRQTQTKPPTKQSVSAADPATALAAAGYRIKKR